MNDMIWDVVVIGGGHAGIEAAAAAARMQSKVLLVTMNKNKIGSMQCNPSIGGLGKGHLVYEVSALGGVMPKLCTKTYLQAKMLNTSKGPAVQGLRLQIDKIAYEKAASEMMANYPNVTVCEDLVVDLICDNEQDASQKNKISAVLLKAGGRVNCKTVVITAGTFLNGAIFVGKEKVNQLKNINPATNVLTLAIERVSGIKLGRLKTGTPPRLAKNSLDYSKLELQPTQELDYLFEFEPVEVKELAPCFVTHTTKETHEIIAKNISNAGYNPARKGMEPRYCPSLETKVSRFPDKHSHHVFIEPESLELDEVYPAGISNSLPAAVQQEFINTIPGLEKAIMTRPGFMIEYDFLQPYNLKYSLECKTAEGLFLAGQVNGTTGYEEAAAQGLIAGINASLYCQGKDPFILSRQESYTGIMIDDLVTLGVDEPYRMFTSRAERRLILRQDNVFERLYPHAIKLGLISQEEFKKFQAEQQIIEQATALVKDSWGRSELFKLLNLISLASHDKAKIKSILVQNGFNESLISPRVIANLHAFVKYFGYLEREKLEVEKFKKFAEEEIPGAFSYNNIPGLCTELIEKLNTVKPKTIAHAQLIPAMTPAAISLLIFRVREFKNSQKI